MDDFLCETPEHYLLGTVRVQVRCRASGKLLPGVVVRIADCHEAALGQR
ncbi:MAG: hypothetical protein AB7K24_15460 [Gemmataceae bacterium]